MNVTAKKQSKQTRLDAPIRLRPTDPPPQRDRLVRLLVLLRDNVLKQREILAWAAHNLESPSLSDGDVRTHATNALRSQLLELLASTQDVAGVADQLSWIVEEQCAKAGAA